MSFRVFLHYAYKFDKHIRLFLWATLPWWKEVERAVLIVHLRNETGADGTMESLSMVNNAKSLL